MTNKERELETVNNFCKEMEMELIKEIDGYEECQWSVYLALKDGMYMTASYDVCSNTCSYEYISRQPDDNKTPLMSEEEAIEVIKIHYKK